MKLVKVRMRAKKVVITFVAIVFFVKFSWDIFTAFNHSGFRMLVKRMLDFTSSVTR